MKKLVLGSLVLATVSQAAGCIITTDDDPVDYATISAEWSIKNIAGQTLTCPPGITTAAVYAQPVDPNTYQPIGAIPNPDKFDCAAGVGFTAPLAPAIYEVWVELVNDNNTMKYAVSPSRNEASPTEKFPDGYFLDLRAVDLPYKTTFYDDGGYFQFDWDTRDAANQPIPCEDLGFLWTSVTNGSYSADERFYCDRNPAEFGLSQEILQGAYTIEVSAVNEAGQGLGPPTELLNKQIQGPNKVTDLGTIMVRVD
jgi:hypothetical protein